jgi:hypothetical protein
LANFPKLNLAVQDPDDLEEVNVCLVITPRIRKHVPDLEEITGGNFLLTVAAFNPALFAFGLAVKVEGNRLFNLLHGPGKVIGARLRSVALPNLVMEHFGTVPLCESADGGNRFALL